MTSQNDPFGPPPTRPPTLDEPRPLTSSVAPERFGGSPAIGEHRVVVLWLGTFATISFSGLTGLLLDSRWSYASLGATFAALLTVVLAVTTPPTISR